VPARQEGETRTELPRVTPAEYYAKVDVTPTDHRLPRLGTIFGSEVVGAAVIESGRRKQVILEAEVETDPPTVYRVIFEHPRNKGTVSLRLSPLMEETLGIPSGDPYPAPTDGMVYRKANKDDKDPIAEIGQVYQPDEPVALFMAGKDKIFHIPVPRQYEKGARFTGLAESIHDDGKYKRGDPILYLEGVE
jgi:hypothetical protein